MTLKAIIPPGQAELTVNGLHQWDYGRKLEIHSDELPAVVEVHFACAGMKEAVVRVCNSVDGVATAVIPDRCLEQTTPVTAWVYVVDDTEGLTTKTITLPIIPRTKPQPSSTDPEVYADKYTEAVTAVNEAVETLKGGDVKVGAAYMADHSTTADSATTASTATVADHAATATTADTAWSAGKASIADYASDDTSKGTIEERLTALGERDGGHADSATELNMEIIAEVPITGAIGTPPTATKYHKVCAVVFNCETGDHVGVHTGIYCEMASASKYYASLGELTLENDGSTLKIAGAGYVADGTLYFCKIGGI